MRTKEILQYWINFIAQSLCVLLLQIAPKMQACIWCTPRGLHNIHPLKLIDPPSESVFFSATMHLSWLVLRSCLLMYRNSVWQIAETLSPELMPVLWPHGLTTKRNKNRERSGPCVFQEMQCVIRGREWKYNLINICGKEVLRMNCNVWGRMSTMDEYAAIVGLRLANKGRKMHSCGRQVLRGIKLNE